jgi:hypothetical protein
MDLFNIPAFRPEARSGDRLDAKPLRQWPRPHARQSCARAARHPLALPPMRGRSCRCLPAQAGGRSLSGSGSLRLPTTQRRGGGNAEGHAVSTGGNPQVSLRRPRASLFRAVQARAFPVTSGNSTTRGSRALRRGNVLSSCGRIANCETSQHCLDEPDKLGRVAGLRNESPCASRGTDMCFLGRAGCQENRNRGMMFGDPLRKVIAIEITGHVDI